MEKIKKKEITCGLIMPISQIDGCSAEHWSDVKTILKDALDGITEYDVSVKLVSDSDDSGVIQKRIVQNIYDSDVVVCDVSAKNPNVMFELGMRLAFDKPTIIIKDDKTGYSFDTGVIEHIEYPRDLRFNKINKFKEKLITSFIATYNKSLSTDSDSFLKSFGTFKIAKLDEKEVTADKLIFEMLNDLTRKVNSINKTTNSSKNSREKKLLELKFNEIMSDIYEENIYDFSLTNDLYANKDFMDYVESKCIEIRLFNSFEEFKNYYFNWFLEKEDFIPF